MCDRANYFSSLAFLWASQTQGIFMWHNNFISANMFFKFHNLNRSRGLPQKFKTRLNLAIAESKLIVLLQLTSLGSWVVTDRRVDPTKILLLGINNS